MFDYKKPCNDCPFRRSQAERYQLGEYRVREIYYGQAFECHKTAGVIGEKRGPQQCVGLIALQESENSLNTITQLAMRLVGYNPSYIDSSDTFETLEEAVRAHDR